jgi:hypothetical protein
MFWGMGNERIMMVGLPSTPTLPISSWKLTHKGSFGREERLHKKTLAMSIIVTNIVLAKISLRVQKRKYWQHWGKYRKIS